MNRKFKLLSILIMAILIVSLVASCGGKNNDTKSGDDSKIPDAGQNQGDVGNTQEEKILADLPEANFNGHVFKILTFGVQGSYEWEQVDLTAEEENSGDTINDAVWKRNQIVEEKFNIKIQEEHRYDGNFGTSLKKEIAAATGEFDLVSPRVIDSAGYMQSGYFLNLFNVPNIDLTKPWYDQGGVKEMSIDHKLFIVLTDALLSDDNATCITVFNKDIAKNYGLGDIYSIVREGKWTVDKLYEFAKATAKDIDGDGKMSPKVDQYGYTCWGDAMITFLHAGGQRLVSKDENDIPYLAFNNPQTYAAMEKAMDLLYDKNVTGNVQAPDFSGIDFGDIFSSGRVAFGWCRMYMIPRLRAMETDFGILPIPKAFETIEGYPSTVNVHTSCALSVPVTTGDIDRATIIMESLSAESKYLLVPAYYDISLKTKHSRDDESGEMLDLILSNRVLDIGDVYNFAEFGIEFYRLAVKGDRNLVSFYEKYENKVNKELTKMMTKFDALD